MDCPECRAEADVTDSRPVEGGTGIRRRRKCRDCGYAFTTYEFAENLRAQHLEAAKGLGAEIRAAIRRFERSQKPPRQEHRREQGPKPVATSPRARERTEDELGKPPVTTLRPEVKLAGPPVTTLRERLREKRRAEGETR